jgi:molybdopterin molybdotransferase
MTGIKRTASCCDDIADPSALTVSEARQQIVSQITPLAATIKLNLREALGRFLAEDIVSPINVPGHDNSAMDGYAIAASSLPQSSNADFPVVGTAYAGIPFAGKVPDGRCLRIMTGAVMPASTDTVIMQEHVEQLADGRVRISSGHRQGQNVRLAGEDITIGDTVLSSGHRVTAADLGVLASLGIGEVRVRRRPRVAFFSTGDELRSIGESLAKGEIYDSNRYTLYGMLRRMDVDIFDMGVVKDDPVALRQALSDATSMADVIITSGGVSVGEADYIKPILAEMGEISFWKIAMKPGRPLTYGKLDKTIFFGLPGNPVSVMVTFYQFVQPALHYLASGQRKLPHTLHAICRQKLRKRSGRFEFQRGILTQRADGQLEVHSTGQQGSGVLTSMSIANCFILLPEDCNGINEGDTVTVQPFDNIC